MRIALTLLLACAGWSAAQAQTSTWTGTTSGDFNTSSNWTNGVPGASGTTANTGIADFLGATPTAVNVSSSYDVQQVTLSGANYTVSNSAGQTLTIDANLATGTGTLIQVGNGTTQTFTGGVVLTNSQTSSTNIGIAFGTGGTTANSDLVFSPTSTLTVKSGGLVTTTTSPFSGLGTITLDGAIVSGAGLLFNLTASDTVIYDPTSQTGTFTSLRTSATNSVIELQVGVPTGFANITIGGTSAQGGSAFFDANGVSSSATVVMNDGAMMITTAHTFTFGSNAPASAVTTQTGAVNLVLASGTTMQTDAFEVDNTNTMNITGAVTNTGSGGTIVAVNKTGTGTLVLSNSGNTYVANATNVMAGTLLATNNSGSATGTGPVSVSAGATLGGTGTITGLLTASAATSVIAPGIPSGIAGQTAATGTLTLSGGLQGGATGTTALTLSLNVSGASATSVLSLGAGPFTASGLTLNINNLGAGTIAANTLYTVMTGTGTWSANPAITFGTLPAGFTGASDVYTIAGTNTLQIEFTTVPEPRACALLTAGLALVVLARYRQLRSSHSAAERNV